MKLKQLGSIAAGAGLLCLVGGLVFYMFQPAMRGWLVAVLLAGALLLLLGAYAHFGAIARRLARRQTKYGLNVLAMVVMLLLVISLVEYFSFTYNKRLDLTQGKRYTLSPQTVKLFKELQKPVKAVAFYRVSGAGGGEDRRSAEDLLRQLADLSTKFRYEFVDPDRDPGMAKRYKISMYGTLVLETPEENAPAPAPPRGESKAGPGLGTPGRSEGAAGEAAKKPEIKAAKAAEGPAAKRGAPAAPVAEQAMREEQITDLTEEKITNALVKITRSGKRNIYFVQGHGEGNTTDAGRNGFGLLRQEVEKANYVVKELFLPRDQGVPEDAAVVVLLGPQKDPAPEELGFLEAYLGRGGKLLVLVDPFTAPALKPFLIKYGLKLGDDVVVDRLQHAFGGNLLTPVVNKYGNHPITRELAGTATVFPYVRSVDVAEKPPQGVTGEKLAESGAFPGSWAETDRSEFTRGTIQFDEGKDRQGPVPLAAVVTIEKRKPAADPAKAGEPAEQAGKPGKKGDEQKGEAKKADEPSKAGEQKAESEERRDPRARLVAFGSSGFANNVYLNAFGNRDLLMNTISWLADQEDLIAIRPKDPKTSPLFLTAAQGRLFWAIPVVFMPLAVAGAGLVVFVKRRQAR